MFKFFIQYYMEFCDRKKYEESNPYFTEVNCPFCKEDEYIISETKYWSIRNNKFPYYGKELHLMALPKRHIKFTYELNDEELKDIINVEKFMKSHYLWEKNYFSFVRQSLWWRSIEHLHYHYLPWHISFSSKDWDNIFKIKNK